MSQLSAELLFGTAANAGFLGQAKFGPQAKQSVFRWATVTQINPVLVQLDGDTDPIPREPYVLGAPLKVGQRVWVQVYGNRVVVLGTKEPVVPLVTELGNAVNLDTVTEPGTYSQLSNAEAAAGTNYPVAYAGFLEVIRDVTSGMWLQRYTAYRNADLATYPSIWARFYGPSPSVWTPWVPLHDDHGSDTTVSSVIVAASGWSVSSTNTRKFGKIVNLQFNFSRTGTAITLPTDGNMTNTLIGTLTAKYRPGVPHSQIGFTNGRTGRTIQGSVGGTIDGDGEILMTNCMPPCTSTDGGTIATSESFSLGGNYIQV